MRRQNPPQVSLDQALAFERNLNPAPLGVAYAVCAIAGFVTITILFAILASDYLLSPTGTTTAIFALLALSPAVLALMEFRRRPDDLLSTFIRSMANSRREPISVTAERCAFKVLLITGETLYVDLAFHYPGKSHIPEVRESIVAHVRLALDCDSSKRNDPPTDSEVLDVVDSALETVASEFNIPVLYSKLLSLQKVRDEYSKPEDVMALPNRRRFATGTLG